MPIIVQRKEYKGHNLFFPGIGKQKGHVILVVCVHGFLFCFVFSLRYSSHGELF